MPAKITVRAELASLLAKSQETTDANRQAQLRREADLRADRQRLQAKEAKEAAARKKPLEDPVGRNIFTAAMGGIPLQLGRVTIRSPQNTEGNNAFTVWSGNGLASASVEVPIINTQQFQTWATNSANPPLLPFSEYGESGWYRLAANTVYNTASLVAGTTYPYSETGGDFRYESLPGEPRPWDLARLRFPTTAFDGTTFNRFVSVLPITGASCIVLVTWDAVTTGALVVNNDASPSTYRIISEGGNVVSVTAAFYVDRTTVRAVTVPAGLQARPAPTFGSDVQFGSISVSYDPWWRSEGPVDTGNAWRFTSDSDDDYGPIIQNSFYTPVQFLWIRSAANGWDGGAPQALLDVSPDPPVSAIRALLSPFAANFKETLFTESVSFVSGVTYMLGTTALQRRDLIDYVEDAVYDLDDPGWSRVNVARLPDASRPEGVSTFGLEEARFWDWGKPAYCRERLLALGFQAADLATLPTP